MLLIAKHAWLLFAPPERAVSGSYSALRPDQLSQTGQLFGIASTKDNASTLDGIRPIGIFALGKQGFAIMLSGNRQIGVSVGSEVSPGITLAETHADYVILERNGMRHRIDLSAATPPTTTAGSNMTVPSAGRQFPDSLTPAQRSILQQQSELIIRRTP